MKLTSTGLAASAVLAFVSLVVTSCKTGGGESQALDDETPAAPTAGSTQDLDATDFDISGMPQAPDYPRAPTVPGVESVSIGGYEVWPGYKIQSLATWIAQDAQQGPFEVSLADCFRKSYWRLYTILQNPPDEYVKMRNEHQGPGGFYVFINDVRGNRQAPAGWDDRLVNYKNSLIKWLGHWDGRRCTQRTRQDLITFSNEFMRSHPPGWRDQQPQQ